MKTSTEEKVDDAIAFESDSPVRNLMMQLFILSTIANLMVFSVTFVVITMTVLQAHEVTWFGLGSSGKGQLDESQVLKINHQQNYFCVISRQVRVALAFYPILGAAIFIFLGFLIYTFMVASPEEAPRRRVLTKDTSVKAPRRRVLAKDTSEEDSEEEDSEED